MDSGHLLGSHDLQIFSYVCHQIPERLFFIADIIRSLRRAAPGLLPALQLLPDLSLVRSLRQTEAPPRKWLFIAAAPLAIDFALGLLRIWGDTHSSRFATGAHRAVAFFTYAGFDGLKPS